MAEGLGRWRGWRAAAAVAVLAAGAVVGWNVFFREPPRVQMGELSCTSGTFSETAVDFGGGAPSWESIHEALDYALRANSGAPTDGWTLRTTGDTARWERHEGGHLVGLAEFPKVEGGWGNGVLHACGETYTPPH